MMRYRIYLLGVALGIILLTGGCSSDKAEIVTQSSFDYSGYEMLAAGKWEEAIPIFQEEVGNENAGSLAYLGLARAEIGCGKLEEAQSVLMEANEKFPDTSSILFYLGEVSNRLEDYEIATDSYYNLLKLGSEDLVVKKRLIANMWKTSDFEKIYMITKNLYKSDSERYLQQLLWGCSIAGIEKHIDEVMGLVKGTDGEYPTQTMYQAYKMAKSGDLEQAVTMFRSEQAEKLWRAGKLDMGDYNAQGKGEGIGIAITEVFNEDSVIVGTWKNGKWEGTCIAWYGEVTNITTSDHDVEYKGKIYGDTVYSGQWMNGKPEGEIKLKITEEKLYEGRDEDNSLVTTEGTIYFKDGKAEGPVILTETYERNGSERQYRETDWYAEIHEFKEGEPQPFLFDTDDGEKLVYEAFTSSRSNGKAYYYREDRCSCSYIWE